MALSHSLDTTKKEKQEILEVMLTTHYDTGRPSQWPRPGRMHCGYASITQAWLRVRFDRLSQPRKRHSNCRTDNLYFPVLLPSPVLLTRHLLDARPFVLYDRYSVGLLRLLTVFPILLALLRFLDE
jgi:hypothetical protein